MSTDVKYVIMFDVRDHDAGEMKPMCFWDFGVPDPNGGKAHLPFYNSDFWKEDKEPGEYELHLPLHESPDDCERFDEATAREVIEVIEQEFG